MKNVTETKPYTAKANAEPFSTNGLRGFRLHIEKRKALVILNNMTSVHKLMLSAENGSDYYFVISESDMHLFFFMANTYNAPFAMIPIPEIMRMHQCKEAVSVCGDKELSDVLL